MGLPFSVQIPLRIDGFRARCCSPPTSYPCPQRRRCGSDPTRIRSAPTVRSNQSRSGAICEDGAAGAQGVGRAERETIVTDAETIEAARKHFALDTPGNRLVWRLIEIAEERQTKIDRGLELCGVLTGALFQGTK